MSIICTDLPSLICKLHTVIHFPQASQSLNGRRKETASISAFLQHVPFFKRSKMLHPILWKTFPGKVMLKNWFQMDSIDGGGDDGHPRRRRLKLNLGFNWRVCSPFTSSVAHTLYPRVQHWSVLFTPSTTTHVQHWSAWVSNSASQNSK